MENSAQNDQMNKSEIFTPRRSLRIRHDLSIKEGVNNDKSVVSTSVKRSRVKRQPKIESSQEEDNSQAEETSVQFAPNDHSSGEKGKKNQKKRNKKSKKQKAKANQKRKQAKENSSSNADSETVESDRSLLEAKQEVEQIKQEEDQQFDSELEAKQEELAPQTKQEEVSQSDGGLQETKQEQLVMETEQEEEVQVIVSQTKLEPEEPALEISSDSTKADESNKSLSENKVDEITAEKEIKPLFDQTKTETTENDELQDSTTAKNDGTFDLSESEHLGQAQEAAPPSINLTPIPAAQPTSTFSTTKAQNHRSPRFSSTPARNSILSLTTTPLKAVRTSSVKKSSDSKIFTPAKKAVIAVLIDSPLVTPIVPKYFAKTPLKSALRSRRSQSLGPDDLNTTSKKNRVVFNSPSNTTINIEDVDLLMKSKKKLNVDGGDSSLGSVEPNVTVRRKRSLSMVETNSEKALLINVQANDEIPTKKTKRDPTPNSRVKLPDFTSVHQEAFNKMESIQDYVARKAERAKVLSTSKSKPQAGNRDKPSVDKSKASGALTKGLGVKPLNTIAVTEPRVSKARQKIELSNIKVIKKAAPSVNKTVATKKTGQKVTTEPINSTMRSDNKPAAILPPAAAVRKIDEKMADRHKKHLSLYKSNTTSSNTSTLQDRREERKDFIVGVRSNRRFLLQMQHRDRLK